MRTMDELAVGRGMINPRARFLKLTELETEKQFVFQSCEALLCSIKMHQAVYRKNMLTTVRHGSPVGTCGAATHACLCKPALSSAERVVI